MNEQIVVWMKDLRFASLRCLNCNTQVTLDFEMEFAVNDCDSFKAPHECPRCHRLFDGAIPGAVEAMQKIYKALAPLGDALGFSVARKKP